MPSVTGGGTLGEAIDARLDGYTYPPASIADLKADLKVVRDLSKDMSATDPLEGLVLHGVYYPLAGRYSGLGNAP